MNTTLTSAIWPQSQNSLIYKAVLVLAGTALPLAWRSLERTD